MATISQFSQVRKSSRALGLVCLGAACAIVLSGLLGGEFATAKAGQHKIVVLKKHHTSRSGVMVKRTSSRENAYTRKSLHLRRSGVTVSGRNVKSGNGAALSVTSRVERSGYLKRRREIAKRNKAVRKDNLQRRIVRQLKKHDDVPTVLVFDETSHNLLTVARPRPRTACPEGFNCGTRLYDNNSGPRIIQLRDGAENNTGYLDGPKIIRLN